MDIAAARLALAGAVAAAAGHPCAPYAPDTVYAPGAWIESLKVDLADPLAFGAGAATARVVCVQQRTDLEGAVRLLDAAAAGIVDALDAVPGVSVTGLESGQIEINSQTLPAVIYTVQFHLT